MTFCLLVLACLLSVAILDIRRDPRIAPTYASCTAHARRLSRDDERDPSARASFEPSPSGRAPSPMLDAIRIALGIVVAAGSAPWWLAQSGAFSVTAIVVALGRATEIAVGVARSSYRVAAGRSAVRRPGGCGDSVLVIPRASSAPG